MRSQGRGGLGETSVTKGFRGRKSLVLATSDDNISTRVNPRIIQFALKFQLLNLRRVRMHFKH
jgi:hypothetical protein